MDSNIATRERGCPVDFWSVGVGPPPPTGSESEAVFSLSRGEALIFVLLLSFGLWAAIWGAVALLAMSGAAVTWG